MTEGGYALNNAFNAQVVALGLECDSHVLVAAVAPEPAVGTVEDGSELAFVSLDPLGLAVAVVVALGAVVGLSVGVVVDRHAIGCPLVTDRRRVEHFQFDFTGLTRLQGHCHFIRLQCWIRLSSGGGHRCCCNRLFNYRLNRRGSLSDWSRSWLNRCIR